MFTCRFTLNGLYKIMIKAWTQDNNGNFVVALKDGTCLYFDNCIGTPLTDKDFLEKNQGIQVKFHDYFSPFKTGIFTQKTCLFAKHPQCDTCIYGVRVLDENKIPIIMECLYKGNKNEYI